MEHILSLSYGKDSLACLGAIDKLGWPLDRIVHAEVWATDTIPADLPPMVEFKKKADKRIKERWGIEVEHIRSKWTFESRFYSKITYRAKLEYRGRPMGWPLMLGSWCSRDLKISKLIGGKERINYVGIAADEPNRFGQLSEKTVSPLVEAEWDETYCRKWCEINGLLSPIYTTATRGGCWFCPKQPVSQLRIVRKNYPELWSLMLKWDKDSPVTFKPGHPITKQEEIITEDGEREVIFETVGYVPGKTVHDYDRRFQLEDEGLISPDDKIFRWSMLDEELNYRWF